MAEVIYSVIIRHIVKWTIVKRVILTGFYELHGTLLYDLLLSRHRSLSQKLIYEPEKNESWNVHVPFCILKMGFPSFSLEKKLLQQVFT